MSQTLQIMEMGEQITELEKEIKKLQRACKRWFDQARENKKEVVKLLTQIEKMKCCENCRHQKVYQDYCYCELKDCARIHHSKWELKE